MQKKRPRGMITKLVLEYFKAHPNEELEHAPVVDWVTEQVVKAGYEPPRDIWRTIRSLHDRKILIYIQKGVYKYDPDHRPEDKPVERRDFTPEVREAIFKRDNYRCVFCGLGKEDNVEIAVDHKVPWSKGGKSTLENGQTLCDKHNNMKKDYDQTTAGKNYFIEIHNTAIANDDQQMIAFCESVFDAYDEHDMNGHIERPDTEK